MKPANALRYLSCLILLLAARFSHAQVTSAQSVSALKSYVGSQFTADGTRINAEKLNNAFSAIIDSLTRVQTIQTLTPGVINRPVSSFVRTLNMDSNGYLVTTTQSGFSSRLPVDVALNSLPTYRSLTGFLSMNLPLEAAPKVVVLIDKDIQGQFVLDPQDTSTPGDSAMLIRVSSGLLYRRDYSDFQNAGMFGYTGRITNPADTVALKKETAALQRAIDYTIKAANPFAFNSTPPNQRRTATLYIPGGTAYLWGKLKIHGAIRILGDGGLSYGGTLLFQVKNYTPIFELAPDTDGGSNCLQLEDMRLRGPTPGSPTASSIYVPPGVHANSLHLSNVWFQNWELHAIDLRGLVDDFWSSNCVYDGTLGGSALSLGYSGGIVTNAKILGNTFYDMKNGAIDLLATANIIVSNNTAYSTTYVPPYFINANLSGSQSLTGLTVSGNTINNHGPILSTKSGGFSITGNTYTNASGPVLFFDGGGVITGGNFTGNSITGTWSTTIQAGADVVYNAPIRAYATGVTGFVATANSITGGAGSLTPAYMNDSRTTGNTLDFSTATGFSLAPQVVNPFGNLTSHRALTDISTLVVSTSGWSTASYNEVVAPGKMVAAHSYLLSVYYTQSGLTEVAQSYVVPVASSTSSGGVTSELVGNRYEYGNGSTYYIKVRYKPGSPTPGLEATISTSGMSGTAYFTLSPFR